MAGLDQQKEPWGETIVWLFSLACGITEPTQPTASRGGRVGQANGNRRQKQPGNDRSVSKSFFNSVSHAINNSTSQSFGKPFSQSASHSATPPVIQSINRSAIQSITQPVSHSASHSVTQWYNHLIGYSVTQPSHITLSFLITRHVTCYCCNKISSLNCILNQSCYIHTPTDHIPKTRSAMTYGNASILSAGCSSIWAITSNGIPHP
jgi:hypothetical protein